MFDSLKKMFEKNAKTISLKAVEDGRTIPMDEVNDQTFAQELLGPGIAIVPSNGTVVSPINGTIATVMDTKHAVCIQGEDGLELIVHAGLDTVELNGKYYQTYKEIGDQVKAGDVLLEFDLEEITKAGYDVTTPIVITNLGDYKITKCLTGQQVKAGEEVIQLTKMSN
jgi:glucose-specific phosphotransferase system IIA component